MSGTTKADLEQGLKLKEEGNAAYAQQDYKKALKCYSKIIVHVGMNPFMNLSQLVNPDQPQPQTQKDPIQQEADILRLTAFNNMGMVFFKLGNYEDCKDKCTRVLQQDDKNTKALYRRGAAYRKLNLYELARSDLLKAKELLKLVGLEDRMAHLPSELSGVEQQRVTIARALSNEPDILLLDEPNGDLDTKNTVEIMDLLLDINLKRKTTCIMVTHNPDVECYADRIIYLSDGRFDRQIFNIEQTPLIYEDYIRYINSVEQDGRSGH